MNPLGFGLKNYDGIGKWRTMGGKFPVDSSGTLPNGKSFATPAMWADLLSALPQFANCMVEKMLTYALGRGLAPYDRRTVHAITRNLSASGTRSNPSSSKSSAAYHSSRAAERSSWPMPICRERRSGSGSLPLRDEQVRTLPA